MVLGGATACTDFIEIDPENKVPEQGVDFTNKNNMYQPVVGAYSKVRTQGMHWCNALLMFTRDGDVWSGRTDDQGDAVPRTQVQLQQLILGTEPGMDELLRHHPHHQCRPAKPRRLCRISCCRKRRLQNLRILLRRSTYHPCMGLLLSGDQFRSHRHLP